MKILKVVGIAFLLASGLALGVRSCYSQITVGIPANIEPDRVRPLAKVDLPSIQTSSDFIDYFLEPRASDVKPGDRYPLVHLRIPKKPHFPASTTSGPIRTYGQTLDTIWPDLAGLGEPGGAACLEKYRSGPGGHCQNLVRIYIDFMWEQTPSYEQKLLANFENDIQKQYIKPIEGKSKVSSLELIGSNNSIPNSLYYSSRTMFYVSRDSIGSKDLVINCGEFDPSPSCETSFTAIKSPNIVIKILFVHSLLPQWQQIVEAVQSKVGSYIVQTYSLQVKEN